MALNADVLREIDGLVRGGFEERARIIEILCEEMYAPGGLAEADAIAAVDAAFTALAQHKATWPATPDCDRLHRVLGPPTTRGVIPPPHPAYTQTERSTR